jgi:hypothetical protein
LLQALAIWFRFLAAELLKILLGAVRLPLSRLLLWALHVWHVLVSSVQPLPRKVRAFCGQNSSEGSACRARESDQKSAGLKEAEYTTFFS